MRRNATRVINLVKAYTKKQWLSIYRPHKYFGIRDMEFCILCEHSKKWHLENEWSNDEY